MLILPLLAACTDQERVPVDVSIDADGAVTFAWGDGPVSDLLVAIADHPADPVMSGPLVWGLSCPGADPPGPTKHACLGAAVRYGEVPARAIVDPEAQTLEEGVPYWVSASGFDADRALSYFRADTIFEVDGGEVVVLQSGL